MSSQPHLTEAGVLGAIVALIALIGGGIKWLFGRGDRKVDTREAKLNEWAEELGSWQHRLDEGRSAYTEKLEQRLQALEAKEQSLDRQVRALRTGFELVSTALTKIDADNSALSLAEQIIHAAFEDRV